MLFLILAVFFCVSGAYAIPITYYGDTQGGADGTASLPTVARADFMSNLQVSGNPDYGLEDFSALESGQLSFVGTTTPLTASISAGVLYNSAWNNWANDIMTISFDSEISAFGVDFRDLGDNHNGMDVILSNAGTVVGNYSLNVHQSDRQSNLPSFWGILSDYNFDTVTMNLTSWDWYDIDNVVAGTITSLPGANNGGGAAPVPEPATMLLFGTGLAGLIGAKSRKKK